jgi:hypothetical protein
VGPAIANAVAATNVFAVAGKCYGHDSSTEPCTRQGSSRNRRLARPWLVGVTAVALLGALALAERSGAAAPTGLRVPAVR